MTPEEFAAEFEKARDAARRKCLREVYGTDDLREIQEAIRTGEWGADAIEALFAYAACMKSAGFPRDEIAVQ